MNSSSLVERVFRCWFGNAKGLLENVPLEKGLMFKWFRKDDLFDSFLKSEFASDRLALEQNQYKLSTAEERLAGIIVLDQFSRNMYRGTPEMFRLDGLALQMAKEAIQSCIVIEHPVMRTFLYMPFMHSEEIAFQREGINLFASLYDQVKGDNLYEETVKAGFDYMKRHFDVIARFGRFPHRNVILGREPRSEETEYLINGGEQF